MSRMFETQCSYCGKRVQKRTADRGRYKDRFCSQECQYAFRTTQKFYKCDHCGKQVSRSPATIKGLHIFCSRSCATTYRNKRRTGKNHPSYIDGKTSYRSKALEHYGVYCHNPDCELKELDLQIPEKMFDVHHIDGDRSNNELPNLVVLCVWCHAKHTRLKEYEFS